MNRIQILIDANKIELAEEKLKSDFSEIKDNPDLIFLQANILMKKISLMYTKGRILEASRLEEELKLLWPNHPSIHYEKKIKSVEQLNPSRIENPPLKELNNKDLYRNFIEKNDIIVITTFKNARHEFNISKVYFISILSIYTICFFLLGILYQKLIN